MTNAYIETLTLVCEFLELQFHLFTNYMIRISQTTAYDIILFCSKCQIFLTPFVNDFFEFCDEIQEQIEKIFSKEIKVKKQRPNIEFIKDGEIISSYTTNQLGNNDVVTEIPLHYDFIVYTDFVDKTTVNNVIYKTLPSNYCYFLSDVKFFFVELQYEGDETRLPIALKNDNYNYYVVNNVLDATFLDYFIKRHYPEIYDKNKSYLLDILDHNVNKITIDANHSLQFMMDGYYLDSCKK